MGKLQELFTGIAVVLDDEIGEAGEIDSIISSIEDEDCHVVKLKNLPKKEAISNFHGASFFIMDWVFRPEGIDPGQLIPTGLKASLEADNIEFLTQLKSVQFAPIFIFSSEPLGGIKKKLKAASLIREDDGDHIFVMNKNEVLKKGLFKTLEDWISGHPSAYVLKKWDKTYAKAKNSLFSEFYQNSRYWPIVIWDTHKEDSVSPSAELGNLIARNIDSRMNPVDFDDDLLSEVHKHQMADIKASEVLSVLAGEKYIKETCLVSDLYSTGDIFRKKESGKNKYYINIRPECDCVARGEEADSLELYLLRGSVMTAAQVDFDYLRGLVRERDVEAVVFGAFEGKSVTFNFKNINVRTIKCIKDDGYTRIGRLIPPYVTRLVERYASYSQRAGLPKIPKILYPPQKAAAAE